MFFIKNSLYILIISLTLLSCSRLPANEAGQFLILGEWESECSTTRTFLGGATGGIGGNNNQLAYISGQTGYEFSITKDSNKVVKHIYVFFGEECIEAYLESTLTLTGSFSDLDESLDADGSMQPIDITYYSAKHTANSEQGASNLSDQYGMDFSVGEAVDVIDSSKHGQNLNLFDVYSVDEEGLLFGNKLTNDGTSSDTRPTELDSVNIYTRVEN